MFRQIIGQNHAIGLLQNAIVNDRVAQAYLFHGSDGSGKFISALYFGMALNCFSAGEFRPCGVCSSCRKFLNFDHPDFIYIFPTPNLKLGSNAEIKDSKAADEYGQYLKNKTNTPWNEFYFSTSTEIRKESIQMLQSKLSFSIHEASYRICIIENAEMMNVKTANAFLKTLEEPPARTVILLTSERISMLLPTIISRCQAIYFNPLSRRDIQYILESNFDVSASSAKLAAIMANGNVKDAIRTANEDISGHRNLALDLLEMAFNGQKLDFFQLITKQKEIFNAAYITDLFNHLIIVINDLVLYSYHRESVINIDRHEFFEKICIRRPNIEEEAYKVLIKIEDYKQKLQGHVNSTLILLNTFLDLIRLVGTED